MKSCLSRMGRLGRSLKHKGRSADSGGLTRLAAGTCEHQCDADQRAHDAAEALRHAERQVRILTERCRLLRAALALALTPDA